MEHQEVEEVELFTKVILDQFHQVLMVDHQMMTMMD